jgi:nucleoside-diphosphate-sugar epimerase
MHLPFIAWEKHTRERVQVFSFAERNCLNKCCCEPMRKLDHDPERTPFARHVRFFQFGRGADRYRDAIKILVTGATGRIGSRLTKRLAGRGDHVYALVRDRTRAAELLDPRVERVEGDLLQPTTLAHAARGVDAVVHCAAFFRGATREQAHATDLGTRHLAGAARRASVKRFVFVSTGLVYGSTGGRLAREEDDCAPTAAYPVSKRAAERDLLDLEGLDVRVLRLPFVYGDGDPHIQEAIPMLRGFPAAQRMSDQIVRAALRAG